MAPGSRGDGSGTGSESDEDDKDDGSAGADDLHLAPGRAEVLAVGRGKGGCVAGRLKTTRLRAVAWQTHREEPSEHELEGLERPS